MTDDYPALSLRYRVRQPASASGAPPVLLLLHGVGSNEDDLFALAPYLDERLLVVSARAPLDMGPGRFGWYPVQFTPTGFVIDASAAAESQRVLNRFIDEVTDALGGDRDHVYLMGFSQGSIMSLNTMLSEPECVSGVVAMSGRLLTELRDGWAEPERLDGFPVLVVHGLYDETIPVALGRAARDTLAQFPVRLTYREHPMGHHVSDASLNDVQTWLRERLDEPTA